MPVGAIAAGRTPFFHRGPLSVDQEFIDLVKPGFIAFQKGGRGEMRFGAVSLELDWEINEAGKAEFTFTGFDEMDETSGKGWAALAQGWLAGHFKFHQGDKSGFIAERWKAARALCAPVPSLCVVGVIPLGCGTVRKAACLAARLR